MVLFSSLVGSLACSFMGRVLGKQLSGKDGRELDFFLVGCVKKYIYIYVYFVSNSVKMLF